MLLPLGVASAGSADPPVPAGRDPGGYPVAIIGSGIDYTLRNVAQMMARDGEGEIIGFDFIDDDRRPFGQGPETDAAEILLGEGQAATLVTIRVNVTDQRQLAKAIAYGAQSPARIIAVFAPAHDDTVAMVLAAAAQKFPEHLFLTSVEGDVPPAAPAKKERAENLLIVTNASGGELPAASPRDQDAYADLAIDTSKLWERSAALPESPATPSQIALARTAALAARLRAVDTRATAAAMKSRITALAKPLPATSSVKARYGWIAEPRRYFWLE